MNAVRTTSKLAAKELPEERREARLSCLRLKVLYTKERADLIRVHSALMSLRVCGAFPCVMTIDLQMNDDLVAASTSAATAVGIVNASAMVSARYASIPGGNRHRRARGQPCADNTESNIPNESAQLEWDVQYSTPRVPPSECGNRGTESTVWHTGVGYGVWGVGHDRAFMADAEDRACVVPGTRENNAICVPWYMVNMTSEPHRGNATLEYDDLSPPFRT